MKISVLCIAVSAGVARLTRHFNLGGVFFVCGTCFAGQARQFVRILVDVFFVFARLTAAAPVKFRIASQSTGNTIDFKMCFVNLSLHVPFQTAD